MLKLLFKLWLAAIVVGIILQLGYMLFAQDNAPKIDTSHVVLPLSETYWEQSCTGYKPDDPCLKVLVHRGRFQVPDQINDGAANSALPFSLFIGRSANGTPTISINFEPPKLDEMPHLSAYANKLSGTLELPDGTAFNFNQCIAKDPSSNFPKGLIQCYHNFETEKLYNNLATGPAKPLVAKVLIPKSLANYRIVEYGLVFVIPAFDAPSNSQLTAMQSEMKLVSDAKKQAIAQAAREEEEAKRQEQAKRDAEKLAQQQQQQREAKARADETAAAEAARVEASMIYLECSSTMRSGSDTHGGTYNHSVAIDPINKTVNGRPSYKFEWTPTRITWKGTGVVAYIESCYECSGYIERSGSRFYEHRDHEYSSYHEGTCRKSNKLF